MRKKPPSRQRRHVVALFCILLMAFGLGAGHTVGAGGSGAVTASRPGALDRGGAARPGMGRRIGVRSGTGKRLPAVTREAPRPIGVGTLIGCTLA